MVKRDPPRLSLSFVTSNAAKAAEAATFLQALGIEVHPVVRRLPEPQSERLEEVASAKLDAASDVPGAVLVEDSGLFVDALGGFPGVYSAYAFRTLGVAGLLRLLDGYPRGAEFRTAAALRWRGTHQVLTGAVRGEIAREPRGTNGFGYDPVFVPEGERRSFAEMTLPEKSSLSHRARAMAAVSSRLRELLARPASGSSKK
ncbi:MAG: non-canonical purine NTP pyrophosphatase [Thermoplasmata archaeon]|nr:non-canonical purine NTP pyrophosphatase [Thermoplasmata archaeon]